MTHVLDFQTLSPPTSHEDGPLGGSFASYNCGPGNSSVSTSGCGGGGGGGGGGGASVMSLLLCQR